MPAVPSSPRVKLRTTSRRVPRTRAAATGVDDAPEPTMRLSRAIMVMLLLHVVAVGGFFASSVLKERDLKHSTPDPSLALEAEDSQVPSKAGSDLGKPVQPTSNVRPGVHVVRPGETLTLIANENGVTLEALVAANGAETVTNGLRAGQELRLPEHSPDPKADTTSNTANALNVIEGRPKPSPPSHADASSTVKNGHLPSDSSRVYTVGKGDNVYTIAQKNKVSYESLVKLNQIDDPKKLRLGQKLKLPLPANKVKTKQTDN